MSPAKLAKKKEPKKIITVKNTCYENCVYYYYFDDSNEYHCTDSNICPNDYNFLIQEKKKCIDQCEKDNIFKYEHHQKCYNISIKETTYIETTHIETTEIKNIKSTILTETISYLYFGEESYECFYENSLINKCIIRNNFQAQNYMILYQRNNPFLIFL